MIRALIPTGCAHGTDLLVYKTLPLCLPGSDCGLAAGIIKVQL